MNRSEIRKKWKQNQSGLDGSYLDKLQNNIRKSQQQMKEFEQKLYNKEIQQRKNDLSSKLPGNNAFTKGPANRYTLGAGILPQKSLENNVNNKFMQIMAQTQEKKENTVPDKSILLNSKAEVPLNKNQLDKLSEMDRKDRIKALKGRSEETLQQAETYTLEKKNKETEKKVNEAEGFNKILPTAEYLGKEFAQNMASAFAGLGATAEHIQGRDNNLEGLRYAQNLQGAVNKLGEDVNNKFIQALGTGVGGVGQQMPQILLGLPGTGALVGGFSEFSNTYNEMTLEDPNNKSKTLLTAFLKGTAAGTLDKLMGGLSSKIFGKGVLDDFAKKQLAQIKNGLVRNAAASGIGVLGEISEEELENIAGYIIDKVVNNKDVTIEQIIEEGKETFKQTGLTTVIMSMFGLGGDLGYNAKKLATQYDMIEQAELPTRDRELLRTFAEENDLSNEELYREIVKVNQENAMYDAFLKSTVTNVENSEKQAATIENEPLLNKEQQVTSKQAKITENAISRKPMEMNDLSTKIPGSEYKYEKSDNEKIDNFRKQAAQYWNNSKKTQNYIKMIEKVIEDKDLVINLDPNMELKDGNIVNGNYKNGVITINPYGKDIAEAVLVHEVTHAIGSKQMIKMVEKFRENNKEFDDSVKSLLTTYNIEEINEEALAFASQELLGNKYFIEDVANNNPTIFEKIYNEIKAWWHQLRGYKNKNEFIEDLYNRWTAAYHSNKNLNQTTKHSLAGEKALFADFSKLEKAKEMLKDNKDLNEIWIETGWTKGDDGKWRFEIDDNKFDIKENSLTPDTEKPLHEILDAEELYDNYPELADINVITTKLEPGVNGSYERLENVIYLSNDLISTTTQNKNYKFLGLHNQHKAFVKLLHEIQHYIQKQEGFARDGNVDEMRSVKNSKLRKLGERIDTLTAQYNKEIDEYRNSIHFNETVEELFKIDNPDERSEALYNYRESVKATPRYKEIEKIDNQIKELENEFYELEDMSPYYLYSRLGGEQESRWVEARIETPSERRETKRPQYTNETTIFAETDDLMYNKQQRGNDNAIQLGDNLSTTSKSGQELRTSRRSGRSGEQSTETSSDGNIYRNIEGNNTIEGDNIQRSEGNIGENNQGLEESSSFNLQKNSDVIESLSNIEGFEVERYGDYDKVLGNFLRIKTKNGEAKVVIRETSDTIYLNGIVTRNVPNQTEKGTGTKIMNNLKAYADKTGKKFVLVEGVDSAEGFYNKFDWLKKKEIDVYDDDGKIFETNKEKNRVYYPENIKDNKGRTLSKEQQEYFKNETSDLIDENGNIKVVYHTTPENFTVFDKNKLGENTLYSNTAFGHFVTTNESFSKRFGDIDNLGKKGKTMELYAKVEKPIIHPYMSAIKYGEEQASKITEEYLKATGNEEAIETLQIMVDEGSAESIYDAYMQMVQFEDPFEYASNDKEILEQAGYDAVEIIEGLESLLVEDSESNEAVSSYAIFNSNQLKNVNNTNPTDNPDIRYSKESQSSVDNFRSMFRTKEGTEMSELLQGAEIELDDPGYTPTQKAINYEQRQKNNFKRNMSDMLGISQYNKNNKTIFNDAIDEMQKEYNATGNISQETKDRVFENMYNRLIKEDAAYYNENKEIKNEIRNTTLYISDKTKADITDYGEFRKGIFGNVRLSNDKTDMPIDTFYKELNSQRPDLFPDTIVTLSDQLQRIAEVSKSIRKSERNLAAYENEMEAAEYKKWAKHEFEVQTSRLQNQFAFVNKYNESKQAEFEKKNAPYSRPDVEEIKAIYQSRNEMRKEVEKQERNILLTDREKAIVKRLLADEMDVDEIMPGYNREGIIKSYYARQQLDYLEKEVKRYRQDKKKELVESANNLITGIKDWKDKKIGLQYSRETAQRNIRDIMSKQEADRINKELFDPVLENTANQIRFINDYNKQIEELNLDKKAKYDWKDFDGKEIKIDEATLAQLLIEKKIDENYLTEIGADVEKITNAADTFSRILNEVVDMMDDVYVEFGYAPVERRKNYFPHFIENKPDTLFTKIADALNFSTNVAELPTDIAGRTESFKPGRAFNRNILKRTTEKTDFNALKALDMYLQGASDIIYHTADIQKLRAFQEAIRDNYRDAEVEKKILEIQENTEYTEDERAEKIREIKEKIQTPLPKLVEWLDEYTNLLANKKSSGDRQTEKDLNRKMYTTMQEIEGKIASNLIGGNLSVSLTNFAPLFQAMGTTELGNILIGMIKTAQNDIKAFTNKNDNFADMSDFLTSRRGNEQLQKQTVKQNISNVAGILMQVIDNFVSESIVRAKYRENIKNGMDHDAALKAADTYARNLMADRSKGALPVVFARKNPLAKLMTSFQVEPNNIISNYFKDMKVDAETKQKLAWQAVKLSAASLVFNETLKAIRGGSDVIPNPIGFASKLIALAVANLNDDEEDDKDTLEAFKDIASDVLGSVPFGTTVANALSLIGVEGFEDTGKFMTSNALPSAGKIAGLFGEDVSPEYRKQTLGEELIKPILYLGLPTGGSQISKTYKGIKSFIEGGSYKYNKKGEKQLQFPVEQNVGNAIKSAVFGKYSFPGATKYIDEGFKSLNGKETKVYEESNIDFDELKTYLAYGKQEGVKKNDKITYVENMNISINDKWNLYKHNIISDKERDDGTSQLSDAEFVINNNMATPEEYMKIYSDAEKNEVEFPETKILQELKDIGLSLKTYMNYKTDLTLGNRKKKAEYEAQNKMPVSKEEAEKRKTLNTEEKLQLINKYTDKEKALIYENYIGKSDTLYQHLKQLTGNNVRINDYLELKTTDVSSDKKNDGTKKGKTITGSAEKKLVNFLDNSNFSNIEKIYIYGQSYKLDASQKQQFQNYIRSLNLPYEEEKEIWLDLSPSNVVEMSDGSVRWK